MACPAHAALLSVQDALTKAEALKARGMLAVFSPDFGVLKDEMIGAGKAWRAQVASARPAICAPRHVGYTDEDAMSMLRAVAPAQRATVSAHDALIAGLNARYRCH